MKNLIKIEKRMIGTQNPCFIIAEAGVNHNGDIDQAKRLIDAAVEARVDAVKFQTFKTDNIVTLTAEKAEYQKTTSGTVESQYEMLKKLELSEIDFWGLSDYATKAGIMFLSTPFDNESVDLLDQIGVPAFKIPSGEITNLSLLKKVAQKFKPIILSTGMATLSEVETAVNYLKKHGAKEIILLHCTSNYPASIASVNLRAMETLRCAFQMPVGYSDHTEGITIPIAAAAMGACIIEKHFTLDRALPGPDQKASLEPHELAAMVTAVRAVELARGNGMKRPTEEEEAIKRILRKSIVAKHDIRLGDALTEGDISIKRPGTGIEPKYFDSIVQKKARVTIRRDEIIQWDMIE